MHISKLSTDGKATDNNKNLNSVRSDGLQLPVDGSPSKGSLKRITFVEKIVKEQHKLIGIIRFWRSKAVVIFYAHYA